MFRYNSNKGPRQKAARTFRRVRLLSSVDQSGHSDGQSDSHKDDDSGAEGQTAFQTSPALPPSPTSTAKNQIKSQFGMKIQLIYIKRYQHPVSNEQVVTSACPVMLFPLFFFFFYLGIESQSLPTSPPLQNNYRDFPLFAEVTLTQRAIRLPASSFYLRSHVQKHF